MATPISRPYTVPVTECSLPHHRAGSRVKWNRWSRDTNTNTIVTGTVVTHERRVLTVRADPDGRIVKTSCGCAAPA